MLFEIGAAFVYLVIALNLLRHKKLGDAFGHFLLSVCAAGIFFVNGGAGELQELAAQLPLGDVSIVVVAPV
ncbi:hypothetical protein [Paraburkholderia caribensis]|uniref:hypothetical protein n=1 Tax=Paraburkholderia caribensis TaxID=75105 RepID=UPI00078C6CF1|nr:hypothetical protein [Paraburkholderia caribensis]AMV47787.1 hypothetical protein ATN79_44785 [Paraburkholderia caribensis]